MATIKLSDKLQSQKASPQFEPFSKIVIHVNNDTKIEVGDDTGRTLEYTDPFGTQAQAEAQLAKLSGFQYSPFEIAGALLDPSAEIGDAVSTKEIYGGIYKRSRSFGQLMKANISAPYDEEVNHEYSYKSYSERRYSREINDVKASILIQSDRIAAEVEAREAQGASMLAQLSLQSTEVSAKVSQTGGDNSSFGWSLLSDKFSLYANNREVLKATSEGLEINGTIKASSGYIGSESSGFTITASALYNGLSQFNGSQARGIYIGTNGIQLGQNFKVDTSGNVSAANITLSGILNVGGQNIAAETLRSGASYGYSFGNATTENTEKYPEFFYCRDIICKRNLEIFQPYFFIHSAGKRAVSLRTKTIAGQTITYLGTF